ncbi:hypothetical protein MY4824_003428 [Beauveria thailandica]
MAPGPGPGLLPAPPRSPWLAAAPLNTDVAGKIACSAHFPTIKFKLEQ